MTNSVHDMGGMHGFGPVVPEPNEPVFHEDWEKRVYALQRAIGATGLWTIDGGRASLVTRDSMVGTGLPKSPEESKAEAAR